MSVPRLVVLVPSIDGRPQPACEAGLRELERRGVEVRRLAGFSRIDFARSLMATQALDDGHDHLFWIDDDVVFQPDDVARLCESGVPLVAGVYPKKGRRELAVHAAPETTAFEFGAHGGVVEVRFVATGFLYTHRCVYESISPGLPVCNESFGQRVVPYFLPFVMNTEQGPWYLGEDFAFCERARRAGHRILVDTRIRLFHVGSYAYGWEDAGQTVERHDPYTYRLRQG
jgi:hypothetical protein